MTLRYIYFKYRNFCENFIFTNSVKKHKARFTYISKGQSDYIISRWFYFHVTLHMRSYTKIKPSKNFQIYSKIPSQVYRINPRGQIHWSIIRSVVAQWYSACLQIEWLRVRASPEALHSDLEQDTLTSA